MVYQERTRISPEKKMAKADVVGEMPNFSALVKAIEKVREDLPALHYHQQLFWLSLVSTFIIVGDTLVVVWRALNFQRRKLLEWQVDWVRIYWHVCQYEAEYFVLFSPPCPYQYCMQE